MNLWRVGLNGVATAAVAIFLLSIPAAAAAQEPGYLVAAATGGPLQMTVADTGPQVTVKALVFGGTLAYARGPVMAQLRYLEGGLTVEEGQAPYTDIVEAELMVGVRPLPMLLLGTGPHVRSYVTPQQTRRSICWQFVVGAELALMGGARAYGRLARSAMAATSIPERVHAEHTGEVGLMLVPPSVPVWVQAGYRIDLSEVDTGAETLEGLLVSVGLYLR